MIGEFVGRIVGGKTFAAKGDRPANGRLDLLVSTRDSMTVEKVKCEPGLVARAVGELLNKEVRLKIDVYKYDFTDAETGEVRSGYSFELVGEPTLVRSAAAST